MIGDTHEGNRLDTADVFGGASQDRGPFPVEDLDEMGKITRVVFETSGGVLVQTRMLGEN
jgi:hypothetical protein